MRRKLFVGLVVVMALAVLGYTVDTVFLRHPVTATGFVEPESVMQLNFGTLAPVTEIDVRPGDTVHTGQVLAREDSSALQAKLQADQARLAADQAGVLEAQQPLQSLQVQQLQLQVDAAKAALTAAQVKATDTTALDSTVAKADAATVSAAQSTLATDQQEQTALATQCTTAAANVLATPVTPTVTTPVTGASVAGSSLSPDASVAFDKTSRTTKTPPSTTPPTTGPINTVPVLLPQPTTPTIPLPSTSGLSAVQLLSTCQQLAHQVGTDQQALAQAQTAYQQAAGTAQLDTGSLGADVGVAQSQLAEASGNQAVNLLPGTPASVALAQAAVANDNSNIAADQTALQQAVLRAPTSGLVGQIGGTVGDIASQDGVRQFTAAQQLPQQPSSGLELFPQQPQQQTQQPSQYTSMLTLNSLQMKVVAQVSETDIHSLRLHQNATVTIPAMPGTSLRATVERVEPQAINVTGKVYYLVDLGVAISAPINESVQTMAVSKGTRLLGFLSGLTADVKL